MIPKGCATAQSRPRKSIAVPLRVSDDAVRLAVITRLAWIRRQTEKFRAQERQSSREYVSGESHYFLGRRFRLHVFETTGQRKVHFGPNRMELLVPKGTDQATRERVVLNAYRAQLRSIAQPIVAQWSETIGVEIAQWGIRRMKTRWGTCNVDARRIWLNFELIKKSRSCIEYIVVHELAHLLERRHNDRFMEIMDQLLPKWRSYRDELNSAPLAHEDWHF